MKFPIFVFTLCLILIPFLSACSGTGSQNIDGGSVIDVPVDPDDSALTSAVTRYIEANNGPAHSMYESARVDLNGDARRDALVLFKLPHSVWCGWDGCMMVVFKATNKGFVPVSSMSGIRGPVYVRAKGQNGWRDIVVRVSGTQIRDRNVSLQFDGKTYPRYPAEAPQLHIPLSSLNIQTFFKYRDDYR